MALLTGVRWHPTALLIRMALTISDTEPPYMCLWAICTSSEKCHFRSSAHFLSGRLGFCAAEFVSSLHILDVNPLSDVSYECLPIPWSPSHFVNFHAVQHTGRVKETRSPTVQEAKGSE